MCLYFYYVGMMLLWTQKSAVFHVVQYGCPTHSELINFENLQYSTSRSTLQQQGRGTLAGWGSNVLSSRRFDMLKTNVLKQSFKSFMKF